jgi:hypothetical protein
MGATRSRSVRQCRRRLTCPRRAIQTICHQGNRQPSATANSAHSAIASADRHRAGNKKGRIPKEPAFFNDRRRRRCTIRATLARPFTERQRINRSAVALASDSAVTLNVRGAEKIYTSAEKLFEFSAIDPIGLMVYNNLEFMGVIIKRF